MRVKQSGGSVTVLSLQSLIQLPFTEVRMTPNNPSQNIDYVLPFLGTGDNPLSSKTCFTTTHTTLTTLLSLQSMTGLILVVPFELTTTENGNGLTNQVSTFSPRPEVGIYIVTGQKETRHLFPVKGTMFPFRLQNMIRKFCRLRSETSVEGFVSSNLIHRGFVVVPDDTTTELPLL